MVGGIECFRGAPALVAVICSLAIKYPTLLDSSLLDVFGHPIRIVTYLAFLLPLGVYNPCIQADGKLSSFSRSMVSGPHRVCLA